MSRITLACTLLTGVGFVILSITLFNQQIHAFTDSLLSQTTVACIVLSMAGFNVLLMTLFYKQYQAFAQWLLSRQDVRTGLSDDLKRVYRWLGFSKIWRLILLIASIYLIVRGLPLLMIL